MKRIRIFSVLFFIAAAGLFFTYLFNTRKILDNEGPVITMDSETIEISIHDGEDAILQGVSAKDDRDGDTTELLLVEQFTNFVEKGRRQAMIAAFDRAGNVTKAEREVIYTDYESPRFELTQPLTFPVNTSDVTKYLTVEDCLDGDITNSIRLSSEEGISLSKEGFYEAVFTISNSAGDTVQLPATVEIYNTTDRSRKPTILLTEWLVYVEQGAALDAVSYVKEAYYGTHSIPASEIEITGEADTSVPGVYELTYSCSYENSAVGTTRLIVVVTE